MATLVLDNIDFITQILKISFHNDKQVIQVT